MNDVSFGDFYEASPDAVVVIDQTGNVLFANRRVEPLLGYLPQELVGRPHSVLLPARYHDTHTAHIRRFMIDPEPRMMGTGLDLYARRKDGSEFKTEISLSPYAAPDGLVVIAAMRDREALHPIRSVLESDVDALKDMLAQVRHDSDRVRAQAGIAAIEHESAQRLQRHMIEDLHHRIKNIFAMVIGITSQTLRTVDTLEQGRVAISSRLIAMAKAQDLLLRANESSTGLVDLISAAIEPYDSQGAGRIMVQDTHIEIGPEAIMPLTMSFNELSTNAVKYGALSNETGRVDITFMVDEASQLCSLTWTETGGPTVQEPVQRGFGRRLLGALAAQLHGDVRMRYESAGLVYQLDIPLALIRS